MVLRPIQVVPIQDSSYIVRHDIYISIDSAVSLVRYSIALTAKRMVDITKLIGFPTTIRSVGTTAILFFSAAETESGEYEGCEINRWERRVKNS